MKESIPVVALSTVSASPLLPRRKKLKVSLTQLPVSGSRYHYEKAYAEENLIAYIGNKRRLLPLFVTALKTIEQTGRTPLRRTGMFIDYFSGTGVVARVAKSLGFQVITNDWEPYAALLARAFIKTSQKTLQLFAAEGGLAQVLNELNAQTHYHKKNAYFSKYYCPGQTQTANPECERLFYTRENGILLDNIQAAINARYPKDERAPEVIQKRELLLGLLLAQASKRANTSGIFKAYHHGFGGRNGDALNRILAPIKLTKPVLSEQATSVRVFRSDALRLARKLKRVKQPTELVYIDPPYNQHQYGANYHILNTIALDDRPAVNKTFWVNGKKVDKSAIRKDWVRTRSGFCYRRTATACFKQLIADIRAKYILVSYSTEGVIPFAELLSILAAKGSISVVTRSYVRFRGGRQTNVTKKLNVEFILIVETACRATAAEVARVQAAVGAANCLSCFNDFFPIQKLSPAYKVSTRSYGYELYFPAVKKSFYLDKRLQLYVQPPPAKSGFIAAGTQRTVPPELFDLAATEQGADVVAAITAAQPKTNAERIHWIADLISKGYNIDSTYFLGELIRLYKKLRAEPASAAALAAQRDIRRAWQAAACQLKSAGVAAKKLTQLAVLLEQH